MLVKNAKELKIDDFNDKLDLVVADLSFISISQVVDVFYNLLDDGGKAIILIKPQFETGKRQKFKNGIIRDRKIQKQVCENVYNLLVSKKLYPQAITTAPLYQDKNIESTEECDLDFQEYTARVAVNYEFNTGVIKTSEFGSAISSNS